MQEKNIRISIALKKFISVIIITTQKFKRKNSMHNSDNTLKYPGINLPQKDQDPCKRSY